DRMATESPSRDCQMMAALIPQHFKVEHERALLLSDDDLRRLGCWKYGRNWLSSMLTRRYLVRPSRARARDLLAGVAGGPRGGRGFCSLRLPRLREGKKIRMPLLSRSTANSGQNV